MNHLWCIRWIIEKHTLQQYCIYQYNQQILHRVLHWGTINPYQSLLYSFIIQNIIIIIINNRYSWWLIFNYQFANSLKDTYSLNTNISNLFNESIHNNNNKKILLVLVVLLLIFVVVKEKLFFWIGTFFLLALVEVCNVALWRAIY